MKLAKILLAVLSAGLLASGCTKEYVTKEYVTNVTGLDMTLIDFKVKASNWNYRDIPKGNDDEGFYEAILEVPQITKEVVDKGMVMVNRSQEAVWTPLPSMFTEKTFVNENPYYFTTYVDFEWQQGQVNIFVTASDLYAGEAPPEMHFRVAIQL